MNDHTENDELSHWVSTYGLITVERILERYHLRIPNNELIDALQKPQSFYSRLLRVPLKNVFNGIILQQARDYQLYLQKTLVDYLLSGETAKLPESPGANVREDLEVERQLVMGFSEALNAQEMTHERLIIESQAALIKIAAHSKAPEEVDAVLQDFNQRTQAVSDILKQLRRDFYDKIIRIEELIDLLPDYRPVEFQLEKNKENLFFDSEIGGQVT